MPIQSHCYVKVSRLARHVSRIYIFPCIMNTGQCSENHRRYKRILAHGGRITTKVISRRHKVLLLDGRQRSTDWVAEYYQARVRISLE